MVARCVWCRFQRTATSMLESLSLSVVISCNRNWRARRQAPEQSSAVVLRGTARTSKHTKRPCGCKCRDRHSCELLELALDTECRPWAHRGSWPCSLVSVEQHGFSLLSVGDDRAHFDHDDVSSVATKHVFFFFLEDKKYVTADHAGLVHDARGKDETSAIAF